MVHFIEVCRRRGLKVNANKNKVMVIGGEEGFRCEIHMDGVQFEQVTVKIFEVYFGSIRYMCCRKVLSERKVAGVIRSLVYDRNLQLEYARVLHCSCLFCV